VKEEVDKAAKVIQAGGVLLYPTDTIYGLGCDPSNEEAVERIMKIKQRSLNKSFILLVDNEARLKRYAKVIPEVCYDLIDYADRPLTIVYPDGQHVSKQVLAEDGSIAIRLTNDPFCVALMRAAKCGLVSTSANISNQAYTGASLDDMPESIKGEVDYIVDLPLNNPNAKPSQIIKIGVDSQVSIIRK
jgi:L-threonylcarbamoyladenylate synthase